MKKNKGLSVFILIFVLFSSLLPAQTHYSSNVSIGVKGGIDLSRVFFTPSVKQSFILGGNAGVTFRYIEENHFGIIAELNLEQRGWKESFKENDKVYPFSYQRTLNYIQIPFLAHIYFGRRGRFFFNAGPEIGYMIGESTKSNFNYNDLSSVSGFPSRARTTAQYAIKAGKKLDFGISAGLGGEFSLNKRNSIYIEGRFYYGLGNVVKSGRKETFRGSNSMSVMLSAGYWFRIK